MFQIPGFVFLMSIKQETFTVHNTSSVVLSGYYSQAQPINYSIRALEKRLIFDQDDVNSRNNLVLWTISKYLFVSISVNTYLLLWYEWLTRLIKHQAQFMRPDRVIYRLCLWIISSVYEFFWFWVNFCFLRCFDLVMVYIGLPKYLFCRIFLCLPKLWPNTLLILIFLPILISSI
jgi:hypothetical protein